MKLSHLGEKGLIQRIAKTIRTDGKVIRGIGEDCAVLKGPPGWYQLFACDMLVEGVHFVRSAKPEAIGWKALAVNLSDIAAMGGIPCHAVISLGLPRQTRVSFVDGLYRGLNHCARRFGVNLVGGDTDRSEKIVIDVAILGCVEVPKVVYRSGAKVGDQLLITGRLGGAVRSGRHLTFTPRIKEARALGKRVRLHAMIDLSDGLYPDLVRICEASGVAAKLWSRLIPRRKGCRLTQALAEGEDFELLMTVSPKETGPLLAWARRHLPCGLHRIGEVVPLRGGNRVTLVGDFGKGTPHRRSLFSGFQHF